MSGLAAPVQELQITDAVHTDREPTGLLSCVVCPVAQLGFFIIVGIPLILAMIDCSEDAKSMLDGVLVNHHTREAPTATEPA